jgi:hypothetical protein
MKTGIVLLVLGLLVFGCAGAFATPSTQIWNPSTDIQSVGTMHLGIDNYFTNIWPQDGGCAFPTDVGLTYGVMPGLEIGVDYFAPSSTQIKFNAKYGIAESGDMPAFAIGEMNAGFDTIDGYKSNDDNIVYGVVARTFPLGRLTTGYYSANSFLYLDNDGEASNTGFILTWDKVLTDKIWACVDYASGYSMYGSAFYGLSYAFASNTSIIFGYGTFNKHANTGDGFDPVITTQLDINL